MAAGVVAAHPGSAGGGGHGPGGHGGGGNTPHASAAPHGGGGRGYGGSSGYYGPPRAYSPPGSARYYSAHPSGAHGGGPSPYHAGAHHPPYVPPGTGHGGGYYGGGRGYYGGHGGYYGGGWHGGWYGGSWYWWGGVYPIGLYFATLPLYYQTFWWGGVPYYYADYSFYRWNDGVRQYEVVEPPASEESGGAPAAGTEPYVYPRQGQPEDQQRQDRYQCYRWAVDQTGFDPTRANGGVSGSNAAAQAGAYHRAEAACLEGRGYTVR